MVKVNGGHASFVSVPLTLSDVHHLCCEIKFIIMHKKLSRYKLYRNKPTTASVKGKGKGKTIPLQAWKGPKGSRKLRLQDFKTVCT
jgi:hypothetical protein